MTVSSIFFYSLRLSHSRPLLCLRYQSNIFRGLIWRGAVALVIRMKQEQGQPRVIGYRQMCLHNFTFSQTLFLSLS